jgi:hypothetical protein
MCEFSCLSMVRQVEEMKKYTPMKKKKPSTQSGRLLYQNYY